MSTTIPAPTADEFAERLFQSSLGFVEVLATYLGDRLGWYRALAAGRARHARGARGARRRLAALRPRVARAAGRHGRAHGRAGRSVPAARRAPPRC